MNKSSSQPARVIPQKLCCCLQNGAARAQAALIFNAVIWGYQRGQARKGMLHYWETRLVITYSEPTQEPTQR